MPLPMDNGRSGAPLTDDRHEEIRRGDGAAPWGSEPKTFQSTPERVSTLRFYLSVIGRRRLPMLIAFLIPVVIAVGLTVTAKKQYQGSALVVINRQSLSDQLTGTPDPTASSSDFLNIITTDAYAARSIQVANRVAQAVPDAHLNGRAILAQATITPKQDADIVQFAVRDPDPSLAQQLSIEFARQFVTYEQTVEAASITAILANVDARLAQARHEGSRSLMSALSSRDEQLRTLLSLQTPDNYVVTPTTNASLVSPRKGLNLGLGVVAGVVLAVLLAAGLEALDTRVRSGDEMESLVDAPVLGRLGTPRSREYAPGGVARRSRRSCRGAVPDSPNEPPDADTRSARTSGDGLRGHRGGGQVPDYRQPRRRRGTSGAKRHPGRPRSPSPRPGRAVRHRWPVPGCHRRSARRCVAG